MLGLDLPHPQFLEKGRNWETGLVLPPSSPRGSDIWFLGPDLVRAGPACHGVNSRGSDLSCAGCQWVFVGGEAF